VGGVVRTDDGVMIGGQPEVAAAWFPVNDHPQDKATYTVTVTVPAGLEAISNGIPLGNRTVNGWTTWRWAQLTPMASYLTMAAIGDFDIRRSIHNGRPMILAFDPDLPAGLADDAVGRTGEMTDFLAGHFGPYPFEANGGIVDETIGFFALEHQSRPTYGELFFEPGPTNLETYVVVHELAHQWFGDSVAVQQWDDIWLNEGFATYAEWLWSDHIGDGSPQDLFDFYYAQPVTEDYWSPAPGDPGAEQVLDYSVYVRGAMTLHALRMTVGDADFDRIIRGWYLRNRNGNGATAEFTSLAEQVSGQQLDGLFHDWLFTDVKPPHPGGGVSAQPSAPLTAVRSLQVRLSTGWR
jgi:aminopeptidase N